MVRDASSIHFNDGQVNIWVQGAQVAVYCYQMQPGLEPKEYLQLFEENFSEFTSSDE